MKASELPKNLHPELLTASCGIVLCGIVFFIVSKAQNFQNTFISAFELLNPTHPFQCFVLQVTVILNTSKLQLE